MPRMRNGTSNPTLSPCARRQPFVPRFAVSVLAAYAGSGDLEVGNLVGSNIANVLLIPGSAALAAPLSVSSKLVQFDVPLVIGASLLLFLLGLDGVVDLWEGLLLLTLLDAYNVWSGRNRIHADSFSIQWHFLAGSQTRQTETFRELRR